MTVVSDLEQDWQTWHAAREQDLNTDYGWLTIVGFDWLPAAPAALSGLPGEWWFADGQAHVRSAGELKLNGVPIEGTASASVAEAGSLSWLFFGDRLIELVLRGGRYAVRQRDPGAETRADFSGVPAYPLDASWAVRGYYTPYGAPERIEVSTARDDLRQHVTAVGTVHLALGGSAYELVATAAADGRLSLSFHDATNGSETAPWRTVTTGVVERDQSVLIDFNRAINLPFAFTEFGTCPAPVTGNRLGLPVTAGEKKVR
ncbi:DUF1684 domain-containing protein [Kribbella sandramycini]|uniref:DUF1684 domain-containing protein n=1 Tax=Kribbella sandramycini TaxID=60450 RepID=A0A7Y4P0Z7_9ACTN|nr:DUF1684 domain-containing protein [Kribbella sandramycini]MBB6564721.1 uncharacterized protein (DUF1684 family) [Kribbella sandramycini]NOL42423.1 DUF1684 domain-containing protein [Kribbella sandramycini]